VSQNALRDRRARVTPNAGSVRTSLLSKSMAERHFRHGQTGRRACSFWDTSAVGETQPDPSICRPIESRPARPLWKTSQVRLTEDMMRVVLEQRLGFVATVTRDGKPNLSPKGTTTVLDEEHLLFADIASPGTVTNLTSSPFVEVNVVDPIRRKGYRFKGRGEVHRGGERFEKGLDVLAQRGYTTPRERIRAVVVIDVEEAAPLVSPVYAAGAQEESVAASWLEHHRKLNS
jgi:uncharacterized protein